MSKKQLRSQRRGDGVSNCSVGMPLQGLANARHVRSESVVSSKAERLVPSLASLTTKLEELSPARIVTL